MFFKSLMLRGSDLPDVEIKLHSLLAQPILLLLVTAADTRVWRPRACDMAVFL